MPGITTSGSEKNADRSVCLLCVRFCLLLYLYPHRRSAVGAVTAADRRKKKKKKLHLVGFTSLTRELPFGSEHVSGCRYARLMLPT